MSAFHVLPGAHNPRGKAPLFATSQRRLRPSLASTASRRVITTSAALPRAAPRGSSAKVATAPPRRDNDDSVRVNKVLCAEYSRRDADRLVSVGRVFINGIRAVPGARVRPADVVEVSSAGGGGELLFRTVNVDWSRLLGRVTESGGSRAGRGETGEEGAGHGVDSRMAVYVKVHKPRGTVCTADVGLEDGIAWLVGVADGMGAEAGDLRMFPVLHLEAVAAGLVLMTNDGDLVHAASVLGEYDNLLEYMVWTDRRVSEEDFERLREQSSRMQVSRGAMGSVVWDRFDPENDNDMCLHLAMSRGRVKYPVRMLGALGSGYVAKAILRTSVMGIGLERVEKPGQVAVLNRDEMEVIQACKELRAQGQ